MGTQISMTRTAQGEFIIDLGSAALPEIRFNPAELDEEARANEHMGARLLLAAAMTCFVNTMANNLVSQGVAPGDLVATAEISKEKDSQLRTHYCDIDLGVTTQVAAEDRERFEAVRDMMLRGSLLTYSLEGGIEMNYDIEGR
ncbi:OsmC family protein [Desulfocurvus sp. DL9XJH121]